MHGPERAFDGVEHFGHRGGVGYVRVHRNGIAPGRANRLDNIPCRDLGRGVVHADSPARLRGPLRYRGADPPARAGHEHRPVGRAQLPTPGTRTVPDRGETPSPYPIRRVSTLMSRKPVGQSNRIRTVQHRGRSSRGFSNQNVMQAGWRWGWDSNPRSLAAHWFSRPELSTTQPPHRDRPTATRQRSRASSRPRLEHASGSIPQGPIGLNACHPPRACAGVR